MKPLSILAAAFLGTTLLAADSTNAPKPRIGVYDSRAVTIAFAGSEAHRRSMAPLHEEHKKATAAGDKKRVKELEAEGKARQKKAHQQAFSTAPVDDILEHIKDQLPAIKQAAGLSTTADLVSKWDQKTLKRHASAEQVDVTAALVDAFHPNEKQRRNALEIQKQKPVPSKRIKD